ncbi:hypothetical protein J7L05_03170 [bacterium]|nr:hypothetical protein [bacterium]
MKKHDCVVIGDSLAAIHMANELAGEEFSVMLVRPDIAPVEVHETPKGAFECDLASGCDLAFYSMRESPGELYGFIDDFELLQYPFRLLGSGFALDEPGNDDEFLRQLSKRFPNRRNSILRFHNKVSYLHDIVHEIEIKTGLNPPYKKASSLHIITQLFPWIYVAVAKASKTSFARFISRFNLPEEMVNLYTLMCNDQLGLGMDSIDTLSGIELVMRRRHGLTRPKQGWIGFKNAMLDKLRSNKNATIVGGKKIDLIKSNAGIVNEIYIDERDAHPVDWIFVDESPGLLGFEELKSGECRFKPLGYYSNSHLDFKLFLGWEDEPPRNLPVGVNFICKDTKYPPHAPHVVRVDVMPPDIDDPYGLKTRITVRGKYPVERIVSSSGDKVNRDDVQKELIGLLDEIAVPDSEPAYVELVLPQNANDPFKSDAEKLKSVTPSEFVAQHVNARLIKSSGINGGNLRIAFHSAEAIASEINRMLNIKKFFKEIAVKQLIKYPGFDETVGVEPKR